MFRTRKMLLGLAVVTLVIGLSAAMADRADAQVYRTYVRYGPTAPVYVSPPIPYAPGYLTYPHWTSGSGWYAPTGRYYAPRYIGRVPAARVYVRRRFVLP